MYINHLDQCLCCTTIHNYIRHSVVKKLESFHEYFVKVLNEHHSKGVYLSEVHEAGHFIGRPYQIGTKDDGKVGSGHLVN